MMSVEDASEKGRQSAPFSCYLLATCVAGVYQIGEV
jgi:hypothetical protein